MTKYTYSEWIEHDGKGMPVNKNTIVRVRTGDDWEEPLDGILWPAGHWGTNLKTSNWTCQDYNPNAAIVAYQIATPIND